MKSLSLRLRVFLFFCLIASGSTAVALVGLWLGYRQLGDPAAMSAFMTSAIVSGFGISGLVVLIWLLFDENISKPIESITALMRLRAHTDVAAGMDESKARYLGDLAPAVTAFHQKLAASSQATSEAIARQTERLKRQRQQLLQILSDIPIAVIVAKTDHQIVLYDGQAAALMEKEAPARLDGSVFDYLEREGIERALEQVKQHEARRIEIALKGHSGALYSGHIRLLGERGDYTLMLEPLSPDAERPLVYDFDLMNKQRSSALDDTALRDLCFVVFDSETTGLNPEKDKVVQLGAVRVINGKLVPGEVYDSLINPGVPIPASSTKVHGIDDAMVADAPDFAQGCRAFHRFASDAVIIAHNAPFDMAFIHRQAKDLGLCFDHPVLDTVHLSAIVFGGSAEHTLDALCERLDIVIPPEKRHTALGDALATAKVLVALLPILEAKGLTSLGALKSEIRKHSRILKVQD
ncbi:3'-5' exonuclease [Litoreibacter arenae]|uniref:DNA-directed DNA polymerase n=1 Tax=Litoreibacter arenae DSM 19593 TaxID=1123360 RepID=S9QGS4_9RHOB|nr:3'-5' exonuclease [Litoreibacter arenae]EPX80611.1 DNA polymerase III epsilon subunit [Litoreibacter arenae DSM 19593]